MKNEAKSMLEQFNSVILFKLQQSKIKGGCCGEPDPGEKPPPKKTAQTNQNGG
jgi:hypothetical protein